MRRLNILSSFFKGIFTFIYGIIAIILLLCFIISFITSILNIAGANVGGGKNLLLAILMLYVASSSLYATFKYQKLKNNSQTISS